MSGADTRQKFALWFAARGFPIIRLRKGAKEPLGGAAWGEEATTDPETIRKWFEYNEGMNYGVVGGDSHVIVDLDINDFKDGSAHMAELAARYDGVDSIKTVTSESPSGGRHLFFEIDTPTGNAHNFGKDAGIDVRGQRGYVVGPGSELIAGLCKESDTPGRYRLIEKNDSKIAPAPQWMRQFLHKAEDRSAKADEALYDLDHPQSIKSARVYLDHREIATEGAGGNEQTYVTFCKLKDFGLSEETALEIVMEEGGWNDRCDPPWDWDEIKKVAANAFRYGKQQVGIQGMDDDPFGLGNLTSPEELEAAGFEDQDKVEEKRASGIKGLFFSGDSLFSRNKRREMIIPSWVPAHGVTGVLAGRGTGKSTIMLDMALRIACGMNWHGMPTAADWYVYYMCGEDDEGAEENIRAWKMENHVEELPEQFTFIDGIVDLLDEEQVKLWGQAMKSGLPEGARAVIFVDTWQRASSRASQSDDDSMSLAVKHLEALVSHLGGPAVAAFHPPKGETKAGKPTDHLTIHGSAVIENMTSAILTLSNHLGLKKLEVTRQKGKGEGEVQMFRFKEVQLPGEPDQFGNKRSGIVATKMGGAESEIVSHEDKIRAGLAEIIKELELHRTNEDPESSPYSINRLCARIEKLSSEEFERDDDNSLTEKAIWARELMNNFRELGFKSAKASSLRRPIDNLFGKHPQPFHFGDGLMLRIKKAANQKTFILEQREIEA